MDGKVILPRFCADEFECSAAAGYARLNGRPVESLITSPHDAGAGHSAAVGGRLGVEYGWYRETAESDKSEAAHIHHYVKRALTRVILRARISHKISGRHRIATNP